MFVFEDFNIQHEECLKFSQSTRAYGIDVCNCALPQSLTQLVDFLTRILDPDDQFFSLFDHLLASNPDICRISSKTQRKNSSPIPHFMQDYAKENVETTD
ncbi:Hypothetical predicted protein [Octopus vulgaris]|uniref:Uncharacterized protein n=1 Tax=Octopus vulgaris TaxID=6645 RepID=A0AA36ANB2_OCTVU|nr:Hypothetical predicted protein [Octopus vulgaris]